MKTQTIDQWLKAGNTIKKAPTKKANGYKVTTKMNAHGHMGTTETHKWWIDDEEKQQKALLKQSNKVKV